MGLNLTFAFVCLDLDIIKVRVTPKKEVEMNEKSVAQFRNLRMNMLPGFKKVLLAAVCFGIFWCQNWSYLSE